MNETVIKFKSPLWIKIIIPFGILIFFAGGVGLCWPCYLVAIMQKEYYLLLFFIPLIIFMFYLCNMGFILFRYRNLDIEIVNEKIRLINNGELTEYKWNDGIIVKDRSSFQVFEMFDSEGKRLFMIDYYFPNFSLLSYIINEKISNPNKDLRELISKSN